MPVRLHVNIDHVATLRQQRGTPYPDPVEAAVFCEQAGADGITVHLREDRRHIQERDVELLRALVKTLLNLEMAPTDAMVAFAERIKPDIVTLVPESREERTTEGGLDVVAHRERIGEIKARLAEAGIQLSVFIEPDEAQVHAACELGVDTIELHTGDYSGADDDEQVEAELERLAAAARLAVSLEPDLTLAAGHGLTARNISDLVTAVPEIDELNIGHALISDALFSGLLETVARYRDAIDAGEAER